MDDARAAEPDVLAGTVRPRLPRAVVHVERLKGASWVHLAEALVDDAGSFRVALELVPGTYRARVSASGGFIEGVSPELTVDG